MAGEEGQAAPKQTEPQSGAGAKTGEVQTLSFSPEAVINRRSRWISSLAALRYVSSVSRDNDIKVRDSDRATAIALLSCCVAALLSLVIPQLESYRVAFAIGADLLVGVAVCMYVANRFGIVTTFQPRQAMLTWQLMLGAGLLGIWLTITLALVIAAVVSSSRVTIPY